jgi:GNAT superfamily N-acetyltransferase
VADIEIRTADLSGDRELLVDLLLKYSTVRSSERRYRWFYEENPHGRAEVLVARDAQTQAIIGSGAVIPRKMYVDGVVTQGAVMADFWIHPQYRSLGPAVRLQRACMERAAVMGFAFFDLPQGNMSAVYQRMRIPADASLGRFSKLLRSRPFIAKIVPGGRIPRVAAALADPVLALADRVRARGSGLRVEQHCGEFGSEFSELTRRAARQPWTTIARSADYLDWRYRRHYYLDYSIFTARNDRRQLQAYAIAVNSGEYTEIVDLFPLDDPQALIDLLLGMSRLLRAQRTTAALAMACLVAGQLPDVLRRTGLRARGVRPLIIREFERGAARPWFLTYGDIDY